MDTAIMTTIPSSNRVNSRSFSSRDCAFRRTHTSKDPVRLLCFRLALPTAKLMVGVSPRALGRAGAFSCDGTFWDVRGEGLTRQPMGLPGNTAAITTATSIDHVNSGSFSSRCCAFRRTHTSADPIRPTSFTLDSLLALRIRAQRETYGLCFTPGPMACGGFFV